MTGLDDALALAAARQAYMHARTAFHERRLPRPWSEHTPHDLVQRQRARRRRLACWLAFLDTLEVFLPLQSAATQRAA
jgi:hypothetical protein